MIKPLKQPLLGGWGGRETEEGGDIYIYIFFLSHSADLSYCMAETNTTV